MAKKIIVVFVAVILVLYLVEGIRAVFNPLLRSEGKIRDLLLNQTPQGTSMDGIISHFEKNPNWTIRYVNHDAGFPDDSGKFVGKKSIRAHIGDYRSFGMLYLLVTDVTVFYGFDKESRLIDIRVWKTTDGP